MTFKPEARAAEHSGSGTRWGPGPPDGCLLWGAREVTLVTKVDAGPTGPVQVVAP